MLYLVATPIGNLQDITLRAIEILRSADAIICEDTRRTAILLNHYQIKKPYLVLNDFNEKQEFPKILRRLINGENLALVTDAGTPLIADPGFKLVRACLESNIEVDSIPGSSSVITALTLSGLPPDKFLFLGYLPEKPGKRQQLLRSLPVTNNQLPVTIILFVSPYKLKTTLTEMFEYFGDIEVTLASELTKIHQSVKTRKISDWLGDFSNKTPKGEFVVLLNLTQK